MRGLLKKNRFSFRFQGFPAPPPFFSTGGRHPRGFQPTASRRGTLHMGVIVIEASLIPNYMRNKISYIAMLNSNILRVSLPILDGIVSLLMVRNPAIQKYILVSIMFLAERAT